MNSYRSGVCGEHKIEAFMENSSWPFSSFYTKWGSGSFGLAGKCIQQCQWLHWLLVFKRCKSQKFSWKTKMSPGWFRSLKKSRSRNTGIFSGAFEEVRRHVFHSRTIGVTDWNAALWDENVPPDSPSLHFYINGEINPVTSSFTEQRLSLLCAAYKLSKPSYASLPGEHFPYASDQPVASVINHNTGIWPIENYSRVRCNPISIIRVF